MSGLEKIVQTAHDNVAAGKYYEALMQYKSLFTRFSRRSIEQGMMIIQDGVDLLSKQADLNAYFGLIDFIVKFFEGKQQQLNDKTIKPFESIISLPVSDEKIKYEENILRLIKSTQFTETIEKIKVDLGFTYLKTKELHKALDCLLVSLSTITQLMNHIKENKSEFISCADVLYLYIVFKLMLTQNQHFARDVYKFIQEDFKEILDKEPTQFAVILTILIMKVVEKKDDITEIGNVYEKTVKKYDAMLEEKGFKEFATVVKNKYFVQQNQQQNAGNPFASFMQSMMGGN